MRSLLASGCVAITLLWAAPSYAQLDVGSGVVGAGFGAALGAIAGGGSGAALGAIVGGSVGATTGAFRPSYAYPYPAYPAYYPGFMALHLVALPVESFQRIIPAGANGGTRALCAILRAGLTPASMTADARFGPNIATAR